MRLGTGLIAAVAVAACLATSSADATSAPQGVYAIVERVAFEPGEGPPQRMRVDGLFVLAERRNGGRGPVRGSIYYEIGDDVDASRAQWEEIAEAAGTGEVLSFGSRDAKKLPEVAPPDGELGEPTPYVTGVGIWRVKNGDWGPAALLRTHTTPLSPLREVDVEFHERRGGFLNTELVAEAGLDRRDGMRWLIDVEKPNGDIVGSPPLEADDDGRVRWQFWTPVDEGDRIRWRVRAVHPDVMVTALSSATFTVRKKAE